MPSTEALLTTYGQILIPDRDEMTYREAADRGFSSYEIRQALLRLYERDSKTIKGDKNDNAS